MTDNKLYETTIPFQGFYCSMHDDQIDNHIEHAMEDYIEGQGKTQEQVDAWRDTIDHKAIREAYSKHYIDFLNSELDIASLTYKALDSPREYNFTTDIIICTIGHDDLKRLYDKWINEPEFREAIKDRFTSYDGFMSFYSNDVADWKAKPLTDWDHNEIGMLLAEEFTDTGIKEEDSFDWNMTPIHEVIYHELPDMLEKESDTNG